MGRLLLLILYRIFQLLITAPVLVVTTIVCGTITIIGCAFGNHRFWGYWPAVIWARICLVACLVRVKVYGRENISSSTSYVFVANHQGAFDIFAIYGWLGHNFKWMMKKSLIKFPVVGPACKAAGAIFVDNSTPAATRHTMEKAEKTLSNGMSVVVFPEGSRTLTGKMDKFHRGAFQLALEFALPIAPITIDGAYNILRRGSMLPHWGTIKLTIHKPLAPISSREDLPRVINEARNVVASALPEGQR